MTDLNERWREWEAGSTCPLCAPRPASSDEWERVRALSTSSLYLSRNQTYRGHAILILDLRHATRADQLTRPEWLSFCDDLHVAQHAIEATVRPDHMNIASLGNVVPHLHWHVIPRYQHDPRWGDPIWPTDLATMPNVRLPEAEFNDLVKEIRTCIEHTPYPSR
jgi:diadenosine tetraphosphate (Ap4A) HIT family hydrolase